MPPTSPRPRGSHGPSTTRSWPRTPRRRPTNRHAARGRLCKRTTGPFPTGDPTMEATTLTCTRCRRPIDASAGYLVAGDELQFTSLPDPQLEPHEEPMHFVCPTDEQAAAQR